MKARLVNWFAGASAPFLAKTALIAAAVVGGLLASMSAALWLQTHRLGNAQERIGEIRSQISQCVFANASNQTTIDALRAGQAENEAKRRAALKAQSAAVSRAQELQIKLNERGSSDVQIIERTQNDCADVALPDSIRLRFAPSGDSD